MLAVGRAHRLHVRCAPPSLWDLDHACAHCCALPMRFSMCHVPDMLLATVAATHTVAATPPMTRITAADSRIMPTTRTTPTSRYAQPCVRAAAGLVQPPISLTRPWLVAVCGTGRVPTVGRICCATAVRGRGGPSQLLQLGSGQLVQAAEEDRLGSQGGQQQEHEQARLPRRSGDGWLQA